MTRKGLRSFPCKIGYINSMQFVMIVIANLWLLSDIDGRYERIDAYNLSDW